MKKKTDHALNEMISQVKCFKELCKPSQSRVSHHHYNRVKIVYFKA